MRYQFEWDEIKQDCKNCPFCIIHDWSPNHCRHEQRDLECSRYIADPIKRPNWCPLVDVQDDK